MKWSIKHSRVIQVKTPYRVVTYLNTNTQQILLLLKFQRISRNQMNQTKNMLQNKVQINKKLIDSKDHHSNKIITQYKIINENSSIQIKYLWDCNFKTRQQFVFKYLNTLSLEHPHNSSPMKTSLISTSRNQCSKLHRRTTKLVIEIREGQTKVH